MSGTLKKRGAPAPPPAPAETPAKAPAPLDDENANLREAPGTPEHLHVTLRNGDRNGVTTTPSDGRSVTSHDSGSEEAFEVTFTLVLPDGRRQTMTVQSIVQMMDLLVQAAASNKLSPVGHQLVLYDSDHHELEYKPSQTIGNVQPYEIHVVKKNNKKREESHRDSGKIPFEMTHRLTINLPHGQKMVLRINLATKLSEVFTIVCNEKGLDSFEHELRHPKKLNDELDMTMSLAQYGQGEIKLINIRAPPSRRGSDDLSVSVSMPNLTQVGQETHKKKRGLFGFLKKSKDKKEKRRSMICFDKNNHQTTSDPPSPTSTLPRQSAYIHPPLATVPESPPTATPTGKRPPSPTQSAKKRHAPPPPSLSRKGGEIVSAEIGPTYQASMGVASDALVPPSLTNSRRSSVVSAAGVSDSTDFTYNAKQSTSPKAATPPTVTTPPKVATPSKVATPPKTPTTPSSPTSTIGRKKRRAPPPPQPVQEIHPVPEVRADDIPRPEVAIETETAREESIPAEEGESEVRVQVQETHSSPILVCKTPPKKPPRPGTPEKEIDQDDEVELRRRGPCTFTAPPPPAEPPQTVTVGTRMSGTLSLGSDVTDPVSSVRSSVTAEETLDDVTTAFDDVTTAFDDVITAAEKDFVSQQESEGQGSDTLCSGSSSTADASEIVDRSITPPPDYGAAEVEIAEIGVTLTTANDGDGDSRIEFDVPLETETSTYVRDDDVTDSPRDDDDDDVMALDDVMGHFDLITSEADDVISAAASSKIENAEMDVHIPELLPHPAKTSPEPKLSAKTSPEPTRSSKTSPEPTDSPKSQKSDFSDKVIILNKSDDLLDFDAMRKRSLAAKERRDSKPRLQKDFADNSPQNTITFKPSTEKEDENLLENKSLILLNKPQRTATKSIKLDAVELNRKRSSSPIQVKMETKATVKKSPEKKKEVKVTEKKVTEKIVSEKKVPEMKVTEKKVSEVRVTEKKVPEVKVTEKKVPEVKVTEKKVTEKKSPEKKVPEMKVTEKKVTEKVTKLPEKPTVNESETPKVKYRYKEVSVGPAEPRSGNSSPVSVGDLRKQFSLDSIGSSFNKEVRIISKADDGANKSGTIDNRTWKEVPVQARAKAASAPKARPVTVHMDSDGTASFGFAPKAKEEIPTSLDGKSKQELKGKLAELHMQFGEMQKQFQQNQALLAKQKVEQGVAKMDPGSPSTVKLGRVVPNPTTPSNVYPPTPPTTPYRGSAPPLPPGAPPRAPGAPPTPGVAPPPPPIGFQVKKMAAAGSASPAASPSVGQSKKSIRPVSQPESREDLMEAIRNKGGRGGLKKVAAKETNWAMTVS